VSDAFELEEIGVWSELKLDIVEQYGSAYTKAFNNTPDVKKFYISPCTGICIPSPHVPGGGYLGLRLAH
jgi:hypothetical protein